MAAAAVPLAMMPGAAHAAGGTTYQTTLNAINGSGGSGTFTMTVQGNQATVNESWSGLASSFNGNPYPHVQHIHIGADGTCPTMSADKNGDGIVDTVEGQPSYGMIGTTLSTKGDTSAKAGTNIKIAPAGPSTNYQRTFTLNQATLSALQSGTGVIVVHGLDPTTLSKKAQGEKSNLVPSLPLAATSPALCGALSSMPTGGVATGYGSTGGIEDLGLFVLGGGLLAAGGAIFTTRKRAGSKA
ncbi:MAG TPA: hypothetical protein VFJ19_06255 [Nocardioidaceae bacterium]|nr:hypothetical protein [Nocardioidaceae bacterium]